MPDLILALATVLDRVEALSLFVGYDPACHAPLSEIVTLEDRLRTIDTTVELMQGQLDEVLALLKRLAAVRGEVSRWRYATDDGDAFPMCDTCVLTTADVEGEYHCPGCGQWYVIQHPEGEFVVTRLYDREDT
jgi:hypothetical protein